MRLVERYSSNSPSLRYFDHGGEGSTLLLLHGVTRCAGDWELILPKLVENWRVIELEHRGHGGSARADSYLVVDYIADAVSFVCNELAKPVSIFGHSLGAMVAAAVAASSPQLVQNIVLEDPPFGTMGDRIPASVWQAQFIGMQEAARRGGNVEEITDLLAEVRLPTADGSGNFKRLGELRDRASLAWSAQCLSQLDPEVLTPVIEGRWLHNYELTTTLKSIRCPTLLLQGDPSSGGALSDSDAATVATSILSCQHVRFDRCGHQLHRDRPEEVLRALHNFLASSRCEAS